MCVYLPYGKRKKVCPPLWCKQEGCEVKGCNGGTSGGLVGCDVGWWVGWLAL